MEWVNCALCNSNRFSSMMQKGKYNLVRCNKCGLVYLNPRPTAEEMGKFYNEWFHARGNLHQNVLVKIALMLSQTLKIRKIKSLKSSGKILDVGCGGGQFLENMLKTGWQTYGVETSPSGFYLAREKLRSNIFNAQLSGCHFPRSYFDVITLWHVFEHIADPGELLVEIKRVLNDDGILVLSIPNIESIEANLAKEAWFHLDLPRHLYFYSPSSIRKILERAGFQIIEVNHFSLEYKQVLVYSVFSLIKRWWQVVGKLGQGIRMPTWTGRLLALILLPIMIIPLYLFAALGRSGTIEVYAKKGSTSGSECRFSLTSE